MKTLRFDRFFENPFFLAGWLWPTTLLLSFKGLTVPEARRAGSYLLAPGSIALSLSFVSWRWCFCNSYMACLLHLRLTDTEIEYRWPANRFGRLAMFRRVWVFANLFLYVGDKDRL